MRRWKSKILKAAAKWKISLCASVEFFILFLSFSGAPFVCLFTWWICQQMAIPTGFLLLCIDCNKFSEEKKWKKTSKIIYDAGCLKTDIEYYANFFSLLLSFPLWVSSSRYENLFLFLLLGPLLHGRFN